MDRDDVTVFLVQRAERYKSIGAAEFYIDNADALHAELRAKGANVQSEPESHPWGIRDFRVLDLDGNELIFAETFE